jgi:hypothetical protein
MSAHERLMTVKLNISSYDGKKIDRRASSAVEKEFGLKPKDSKAGEYKANLFLGADKELRDIDRAINALRAFHYSQTFRWEANEQLLACENFQNYYDFTSRMKALIEQRVETFAGVYDQRVGEALSNRGGLAAPADYPTKAEMLARYSVGIQFGALDSPEDLRLKIQPEHLAALKSQVEEALTSKLTGAMANMAERLQTLVTAAKDQLFKTPATGRYHASWQQNLQEFVGAARGLNLSGDEKLEGLFDSIEDLCKEDPELLKESLPHREAAAQKAQSIFDAMSGIFGGSSPDQK